MTEYATKDDVKEIVNTAVTKAVDDLSEIMQTFMQNVDDRFNDVDKRFNDIDDRFNDVDKRFTDAEARRLIFEHRVDTRFDQLDAEIAGLNAKYDKLLTTLDTFLKRLDDIETNNLARDAQLARLERWIEQVAAKTGVKLEY